MNPTELAARLRTALDDIALSKRSNLMGGPMLMANSDDTLEEDAERRIAEVASAIEELARDAGR